MHFAANRGDTRRRLRRQVIGLAHAQRGAAGMAAGDGGLGHPWLYVDGMTGAMAGSYVPDTGSAGDLFMQAQFPLHSGRILGLPGRLLISLMGVLVAVLSVTGLVLWVRKRRARMQAAARKKSAAIHGKPMDRARI